MSFREERPLLLRAQCNRRKSRLESFPPPGVSSEVAQSKRYKKLWFCFIPSPSKKHWSFSRRSYDLVSEFNLSPKSPGDQSDSGALSPESSRGIHKRFQRSPSPLAALQINRKPHPRDAKQEQPVMYSASASTSQAPPQSIAPKASSSGRPFGSSPSPSASPVLKHHLRSTASSTSSSRVIHSSSSNLQRQLRSTFFPPDGESTAENDQESPPPSQSPIVESPVGTPTNTDSPTGGSALPDPWTTLSLPLGTSPMSGAATSTKYMEASHQSSSHTQIITSSGFSEESGRSTSLALKRIENGDTCLEDCRSSEKMMQNRIQGEPLTKLPLTMRPPVDGFCVQFSSDENGFKQFARHVAPKSDQHEEKKEYFERTRRECAALSIGLP
ncbi:unnamed protein product [Cyprideis torosa]|uniref:Uncharacterized protein n=1 Tax=Cyprideis torosa TaxID=163714 RepID=A0A7R8ZK40_9CRUS|nr:unnamed protein product [Cyprideis torosa]CAG0888487.1 unnamed protein product [Cyprideis torosa]